MCEILENSLNENKGKFSIFFNQDYSSLAVSSQTGYKLFAISSINKVDEIYCSENVDTKIAERLFSSSLVAVVTNGEPNKLKVCHFKKGSEICNYKYPSEIQTVKLNRSRLIVCISGSIYIHNIRDMRLLHSIKNLPVQNGLCALSLSSHLAYPASTDAGIVQIFDAGNLQSRLKIPAHDSLLSALSFSSNGLLLATASTKGTVIRVFCVKNGQRVHEFRRGVKRYVQIASLNFSICANYVSASSNTETVHIFKIDPKSIENAERRSEEKKLNSDAESEDEDGKSKTPESSKWSMNFLSKAVQSYFPTNVSDVLSQDRAFAHIQLPEPGLKYQCCITKLEKETRLLVACEDGFLYIYSLDDNKGGECKLIRAHDLRNPLFDITELDGNENEASVHSTKSLAKSQTQIPDITTSLAAGSYAGVLRGRAKDEMTESDKLRNLTEAVDYPPKSSIQIFDDAIFPPVQAVCQ